MTSTYSVNSLMLYELCTYFLIHHWFLVYSNLTPKYFLIFATKGKRLFWLFTITKSWQERDMIGDRNDNSEHKCNSGSRFWLLRHFRWWKKKKIWNLNVITCRALKIEEKKYYKDCCLVLAYIRVPKRQMSTGGIQTKGTCSYLSNCM